MNPRSGAAAAVRAVRGLGVWWMLAPAGFALVLALVTFEGADAVALYLALTGAILVGVRRGWGAAAVLVAGALVAIVVVGFVALTSDPCLPSCLAADSRETLLGAIAPVAATLAWVGAVLAHRPLASRWGRAASALVLVVVFAAALTGAAVAEASVEVTTCDCG
jgi:hypothetical protein